MGSGRMGFSHGGNSQYCTYSITIPFNVKLYIIILISQKQVYKTLCVDEPKLEDWKFIYGRCPRQPNWTDCGLHVVVTMRLIAAGLPLIFVNDSNAFRTDARHKIAIDICRHSGNIV